MSTQVATVPMSEVIGAAAQELRDLNFGKLGRPFYASAAQRGLTKMCLDVPWDVRHWSAQIPEDLILHLPNGLIGLQGAWVHNGDQCDLTQAQKLFIKPNMYHSGAGEGYVAGNMGGGFDIMPGYLNWSTDYPSHWICFAGEHKGKLYMSGGCSGYGKIHLSYNGIGMECWGDEFDIPMWAREAVTDYVLHRAARALEQDNLQYYRGVIQRTGEQISTGNPNGTWVQAMGYWGRMDKKERDDLIVSITRFGFPPY